MKLLTQQCTNYICLPRITIRNGSVLLSFWEVVFYVICKTDDVAVTKSIILPTILFYLLERVQTSYYSIGLPWSALLTS